MGFILWKIMSSSIEPMSPRQLKKSPKLKLLVSLCNQTVIVKTNSETLYYSLLKQKYTPSIVKQNRE